jgi:hypothetical protein
MVACQENTCLGLNKDENRQKGFKENSYPNIADQGNSYYNIIKQSFNSLSNQVLTQTRGTIIPQVGMIINIYYNDVAYYKS